MMEWLPLHFIRPIWLTLLPLAVILPLLWRHLRRPSGDWSKICDNHLLRWLSVGDAAAKRSRLGPWLAGLMWLIGALALAGPSWQKLPDSSFTSHDARVLVLGAQALGTSHGREPWRHHQRLGRGFATTLGTTTHHRRMSRTVRNYVLGVHRLRACASSGRRTSAGKVRWGAGGSAHGRSVPFCGFHLMSARLCVSTSR